MKEEIKEVKKGLTTGEHIGIGLFSAGLTAFILWLKHSKSDKALKIKSVLSLGLMIYLLIAIIVGIYTLISDWNEDDKRKVREQNIEWNMSHPYDKRPIKD